MPRALSSAGHVLVTLAYQVQQHLHQHHHQAGSRSGRPEAILNHITRLYYMTAADCPDIIRRWGKFFPDAGLRETLLTNGKLWLLNRFHIRPESRLFKRLKKLYLSS